MEQEQEAESWSQADDDGLYVGPPEVQPSLPRSYKMLQPLPLLAKIEANANEQAKSSYTTAAIMEAQASELAFTPADTSDSPRDEGKPDWSASQVSNTKALEKKQLSAMRKPLEPYDLFRALEKKDLDTIFRLVVATDHIV